MEVVLPFSEIAIFGEPTGGVGLSFPSAILDFLNGFAKSRLSWVRGTGELLEVRALTTREAGSGDTARGIFCGGGGGGGGVVACEVQLAWPGCGGGPGGGGGLLGAILGDP